MNYRLLIAIGLLFNTQLATSQQLTLKGKIRCMNPTPSTTKGAENIIVVPGYAPSLATFTASFPTGYFEINTGMPFSKLEDKVVSLHAISKCKDCKETTKRVFISADQFLQKQNETKRYVTVKDWLLKSTCQQVELSEKQVDSIITVVMKQSDRDLDHVTAASALTATPAFLNLLTSLTTVVGVGGIANVHYHIKQLGAGKIRYGNFMHASPMYHSANTGFNFSPGRDMSEAVFWNPSAIALSKQKGNMSLLSNAKNIGKLSGFIKANDKLSIGAGFIFSTQDEFRKGYFESSNSDRNEDSMLMKVNEYTGMLSAAYKVNSKLGIGLGAKYMMQSFNIPDSLFCDNLGFGTFIYQQIKLGNFDIDFSATYKANQSLQFGLNLMNILGSKLHSDAFIPYQYAKPWQQQRAAGLGVLYKYRRFNAGADALINEAGLYDLSVGANFVPFTNALISAGFTAKQMSYSLAFRLKHFRIAYINDNGLMVQEKRVGNHKLLNGRVFGGFVVDLD
ncbi:MAG: hypothetical protein IPI46_06750 [Bacteroidetes bacterium]|nr:hypothetical protein [Bacteroidota bacterium]